VLIGRAETNGVSFLHKSLSRQHARLEVRNGRITLTDLNSKNGTFVRGERIQSCELQVGDSFRCGDVPFELVLSELMPTAVRDIRQDVLTRIAIADLISSSSNNMDSTGSALKVRHASPEERTRDKLQILLKVSQLLSSPEAIDALLEKILELMFQLLEVDRAVILLAHPLTGELTPKVTRSQAQAGPTPARFYSQHIVGYVKTHHVAALFADARLDPRLGQAESVMLEEIRTSMCVPLKPKDQLLGVLYVDNRSGTTQYTAEDLEFLTAFANQAAIAIENANLSKRLEDEAVLRNNFLRFFPPATLKRLELSGAATLEVVERDVTAIFADISNYTAMTSAMEPREVVDMLNEYFPVVSDVVFRHEGTLEKYIGDALLAVWGAPFSHPEDVDRALRAAVEMQQALIGLNVRLKAGGRPEIQIHLGVNSGRVAAGNIGSERYLQYATIGDTTNVASRICSVAGPGEIVISETTYERLRERQWPMDPLPPVMVKGKDAPLSLYNVRWRDAG
jgi:adenylate cyclase